MSDRIAIQGEAGSFSHEATLALSPGAEVVPCAVSSEVFARVVDGSVDAAVIPIENSLAGSVVEHYDLLFAHPVRILRESLLRIRHTLIAPPGLELRDVRRVFSHPVALAQCRRFFDEHPSIEAMPFYDTAGSVRHILSSAATHEAPNAERPSYLEGAAAIASIQAARVYGATVLLTGLEDNAENYTRFFTVARESASGNVETEAPPPSAHGSAHPTADAESARKVSLAFAVRNSPGTLVAALEVFSALGTNLTRIESRPIPGQPWHYIFYADYELPTDGPGQSGASGVADEALRRLAAHCSTVKELGRYRAAVS